MHVGCSSLTEPLRCGTMVLVPTMHVGCSKGELENLLDVVRFSTHDARGL